MNDSIITLNMPVSDTVAALSFYEEVFGADHRDIFLFPDMPGKNMANITIGGTTLRLIDESKEYDFHAPTPGNPDALRLQIRVDDILAVVNIAVAHGATIIQSPSDFRGVRYAMITDPFGYTWAVHEVLEELTPEERRHRYMDIREGLAKIRDKNRERNWQQNRADALNPAIFMLFSDFPGALPLYVAVESWILKHFEEVQVAIRRSHVSFSRSQLFAAIWPPAYQSRGNDDQYVVLTFMLNRRVEDPRIIQPGQPHLSLRSHHVIIRDPGDLDGQLLDWVKEAHYLANKAAS